MSSLDCDFAGFVDNMPSLRFSEVCAVGLMGEQTQSEQDPNASTLVGISSVAGERSRATNYVYGAAKAGFTAFLSSLRNRLA